MSSNWQNTPWQHTWHPCSQMHDYEAFPPLMINSANGAYLQLQDGRRIIDAISSWWCKSLGHRHPAIIAALQDQLAHFEHVIFANTTHETAIQLSARLAKLSPSLSKVFYTSDGSCAVEAALKMSLHTRLLRGDSKRTQWMALENAYHGETGFALAVSDLGLYRQPYQAALCPTYFLTGIPYVNTQNDPLWFDCSDYWPALLAQLELHADTLTAVIVEPIVQGAGGMKLYSADFLKRLRQWTQAHDIHLIADEIMTGLYRTGPALACQHAAIEPDFLCLGKGLTSGALPLAAMLTSDSIYELFYDDYAKGKSFLHSHTHSGNVLAMRAALACLTVMDSQNMPEQVDRLSQQLQHHWQTLIDETQALSPLRGIGGLVASDLINPNNHPRLGYQVYRRAVELGALLRPLGNTLYWLPPLNITPSTLHELAEITREAVRRILLVLQDAETERQSPLPLPLERRAAYASNNL